MTVADSLQYNATFANIWRHIGKIFAQNFVVYRIMAVADSLQYNATFANIWRHNGKIFAQNFVVYR